MPTQSLCYQLARSARSCTTQLSSLGVRSSLVSGAVVAGLSPTLFRLRLTHQPRRALHFGERRRGGGPEPDTFSTASHSLRKQDSKNIRASYIFLWTFKNRSCTVEMRRDSVSLMR